MLKPEYRQLTRQVALISIILALYSVIAGLSANRGAAFTLHQIARDIVDTWQAISVNLGQSMSATSKGDLAPVIPANYSALDLAVFGDEIVSPEYKSYYKQLELPRNADRIYITPGEEGNLHYFVGGAEMISIKSITKSTAAVFFVDTPKQVIDEASFLFHSVKPNTSNREGQVIFDATKSGRNVLGVFLRYDG